MQGKLALSVMAVILLLINISIFNKEQHLAHGKVIYLELAPVDPRSLMQGDYMRLSFQLGNSVYSALPKTGESRRWGHNVDASDGYVIARLDSKRIARFKALYNNQPVEQNEILLRYRVRNGVVKFATNAFFFQEGQEPVYRSARFGQFRVNEDGELLLAAMYDEHLNKLRPDTNIEQMAQ